MAEGAEHDSDDDEKQSLLPAGDERPAASAGAGSAAPTEGTAGLARLLRVRHYPLVLLAGLLFDLGRIGMAFIGPFYMNDATHSPRLVQVTSHPAAVLLDPLSLPP